MPRIIPDEVHRIVSIFALVLLGWLAATSTASAKPAQVDVPVVLQLIGVSGEMASLDHVVARRLVSDYAGGDPIVSPLETGFQLDFTPTLLGGGQVAVTLDLSIAFLAGPIETRSLAATGGSPKVQEAELKSYMVSSSFQVADGETVALDPVPAGPPILATTRIVVDPGGGSPSQVFLEVRVPFGGHEIEMERLRLVKNLRVLGVSERRNSLGYLTRRTFVGEVASGETVTTQLEGGSELAATTAVAGAMLGLDLRVRCRVFDEEVPAFKVVTLAGKQPLQLPVLRTLEVNTSVDAPSGATIAIAGIRTSETEILIFVTPRLVDQAGRDHVLVEARLAMAAQGEPKEPKGEPRRSESLKDLQLTSWDGQAMALAQVTQRDFVTGHQDGEPVTAPLATQARLQFTPTLLGGDDVDLELAIEYGDVGADVARLPVKTPAGARALDLPVVHLLQVDTAVTMESGQTVVLGGILRDEARQGRLTRDEALVLATPQVGAGGDPDAVALSARVVHVSEGDGPAGSSVQYLESGPVVGP